MVSKEFRQFIDAIKANPFPYEKGITVARKYYDALADILPPPEVAEFNEVRIDGVRCEWTQVPESREDKVIMYTHGGGYVLGSIPPYRSTCAHFAQAGKAKVLSVDYRLAPEYTFPSSIEDTTACYKWLLNNGYKAENIIVAGDSAGGGLTLATLLNIRDLGLKKPAAAICFSPYTDLTFKGASITTKKDADPILTYDFLKSAAQMYVGSENKYDNPLISPVYANLAGLPPMLLFVGTAEILLDDTLRVAENAKKAGIDVKLIVEDDLCHIWPVTAEKTPEGQKAWKQIEQYIGNLSF